MFEEHSLEKLSSLNEAFKNYEPTRVGLTPKTQNKLKNNNRTNIQYTKQNIY